VVAVVAPAHRVLDWAIGLASGAGSGGVSAARSWLDGGGGSAAEQAIAAADAGSSIRLIKDRSGATAIEYGLIVALVTLVIVTAVTTVGNNLSTKFATVATKMAPAA